MSNPDRSSLAHRSTSRARRAAAIIVLLALSACGGADEGVDDPQAEPRAPQPAGEQSAWRSVDGAHALSLPPDWADPHLGDAIAEARRTAESARVRWLARPAGERDLWAIKWAAPTQDGGVEHIWVEPEVWSPFRVEGRLANAPQRPLQCGRVRGDLVGFSADELVDWVHLPVTASADAPGPAPREGGFTLERLEERFGPAGAGGHSEVAPREPR